MKDQMPVGWTTAKLEDLIDFALGGDWGKDETHDDPDYIAVRCIRASELRSWEAEKGHTAALRKIKKTSLEKRELIEGDILVEISGGGPDQPVGRTVLIDKSVLAQHPGTKKICTNFFRLIRPSSQLNSTFLNLYLQSFYRSGKISAYQAGSNNLRNLKFHDYMKISVPVAPIDDQHRIVAKIEELFSELDKGIESLKTAREQLKVYRQAVLKHAFEGKLTEQWRKKSNAQEWIDSKLGDLLTFLTSGSRGWADYYSDEGDTFIRAQNLKFDRLDLEDVAYVSLPEKSEGKRTRVQIGDILITITGANVTKAGYVKSDLGDAYVSQHVALCRPTDDVDTEYLYWFLIAEVKGRRQLNEFAYGAGKPGLNLDNIRSVDVVLPSIDEQTLIVEKIKELLSVEESVSQTIDTEIQRIETLRQSILSKAFSGQLTQQDLNDEPADMLLVSIKTAELASKAPTSRDRKIKPRRLHDC